MSAPDMTSYRLLHQGLREDATRLHAALRAFRADDDADARSVVSSWYAFAGELRAHHETEEAIVFPQLVELVPIVVPHIECIQRDHRRLEELTNESSSVMAALRHSASAADAATAADLVGALSELLEHVLDLEDEDVLPLLGRHMSRAEYAAMELAATNYARCHGGRAIGSHVEL